MGSSTEQSSFAFNLSGLVDDHLNGWSEGEIKAMIGDLVECARLLGDEMVGASEEPTRGAGLPGAAEEFYVVLCAKGLEKARYSKIFPTKLEADEACMVANDGGGRWHVARYLAQVAPSKQARRATSASRDPGWRRRVMAASQIAVADEPDDASGEWVFPLFDPRDGYWFGAHASRATSLRHAERLWRVARGIEP